VIVSAALWPCDHRQERGDLSHTGGLCGETLAYLPRGEGAVSVLLLLSSTPVVSVGVLDSSGVELGNTTARHTQDPRGGTP